MANFEARSAQQPDLDDIGNLVRFKGCYFLKEIKKSINKNGWPIRIATISGVDTTGELDLRLIGDNFQYLSDYCGDYLNLEAAIKRYNGGYFYYLAWVEVVVNITEDMSANFFDLAHQTERKDLENKLRIQCHSIEDPSIRKGCDVIINLFGTDLSTSTLKKLLLATNTKHANELCADIAKAASDTEKCNDIGIIGTVLSNLENKTPLDIWTSNWLGT